MNYNPLYIIIRNDINLLITFNIYIRLNKYLNIKSKNII